MFDLIFALMAFAAAANPPAQGSAEAPSTGAASVVIGSGVQIGSNTVIEGLVAEPQTPSGKFTTATEVKPILTATKANWIAVRDYGGNDLLYVTHLWSWRCGLAAISISVNDGPLENLPLPDCHTEYATPNAILEQDGLPYLTYPQNSINTISVRVTYDDLSRDTASLARGDVLIP
ncbi:hypothetical protein [Sulfitobacter sp.]|uniref:hypothetical protein n=1 Tax=Sulfitobacter sp. TaxID=1903071 RepID=UPI00300292AB